MPDFGRTPDNIAGGEPSFDDIRRSDSFIDALAAGGPITPQDQADADLAALLGGWRDEMRVPPATGLITEEQAVAALNAGLAEKPQRTIRERRETRRETSSAAQPSRRGLSLVGAAAAAVLCIGGFGAVVAGAGPGDALYGLRSMLFGAPKEVRDDQVALAARTELRQVQELIAQGDWQQAQEKLVAVSTQVATIGDEQQKQDLLEEFNDLSAKVVERNPEATAAPGIIYTVPPEATELVPAVAPPTSTPSAPPVSDTSTTTTSGTTTATTSGTAASTTATTSGSAATTTPTSGTPTTTGAPTSASAATAATTSAPAATSAAPATTSAPAATSAATSPASPAQASTTAATTSGATTASATTTSAPATGAATTSAAPKSAASTTSAVPSPAQATTTPAATTTAPASAPATTATATPTAEESAESAPEVTAEEPAPVTTTTVVPVG